MNLRQFDLNLLVALLTERNVTAPARGDAFHGSA